MKLETDRLIIRELEESDAEDIAKNAHDPDIYYYTAKIPYPYTIKEAKDWIKISKKERKKNPRKKHSFVIELKEEGEVIGSIGLTIESIAHKRATIGYWIGKEYRRKGYISEAEEKIIEWGFNDLGMNKIKGQCVTDNKGSIRLFEKFGFRKIGIGKEELIKNNEELEIEDLRQDCYSWELLKKDWENSE